MTGQDESEEGCCYITNMNQKFGGIVTKVNNHQWNDAISCDGKRLSEINLGTTSPTIS